MAGQLGELERAVMDVLWSTDEPMTAREVADSLSSRDPAKTTVLTVLARLEKKELVARSRIGWAHTYQPQASREDYVAELMRDALGGTKDRTAALVRFADSVSEEEAQALLAALRGPVT